jgi:hypothetical protein
LLGTHVIALAAMPTARTYYLPIATDDHETIEKT